MTNFVLHLLNLNQANPTEKCFECSDGPSCHLVEKPCFLQWVGCCICDREKISAEMVTVSYMNKTAEWGWRMQMRMEKRAFPGLTDSGVPTFWAQPGTLHYWAAAGENSVPFLPFRGVFLFIFSCIEEASKVCPGVVPSFACYAPELWQRCFFDAWRKWKGNRKPNAPSCVHRHNCETKLPMWNWGNFMGNCLLNNFPNLGLYQAIHMVNPFGPSL